MFDVRNRHVLFGQRAFAGAYENIVHLRDDSVEDVGTGAIRARCVRELPVFRGGMDRDVGDGTADAVADVSADRSRRMPLRVFPFARYERACHLLAISAQDADAAHEK